MDEVHQWLADYAKYRAGATGTKAEQTENGWCLKNASDGAVEYYFLGEVSKHLLTQIAKLCSQSSVTRVVIVQESVEKNVLSLVPVWDEAVAIPCLVVMFVDVAQDDKWMVKPALHDKVCERDHLEKSLLALMNRDSA